jgi:hypothetical protein
MRYSILILIMIFMTACSQTVKVKQEDLGKTGMLDEVPKWFVEHPNKKKDKNFIYGVGVATSPDLQLAKDKAMMIAKADIADIVAGEMNKKATLYRTEVGAEGQKSVVSESDNTIINIIKNIKITGYEQWKYKMYTTADGNYRVYIGLVLPIGEYNKLHDLIEEEKAIAAQSQINSSELAKVAVEDLTNDIEAGN